MRLGALGCNRTSHRLSFNHYRLCSFWHCQNTRTQSFFFFFCIFFPRSESERGWCSPTPAVVWLSQARGPNPSRTEAAPRVPGCRGCGSARALRFQRGLCNLAVNKEGDWFL